MIHTVFNPERTRRYVHFSDVLNKCRRTILLIQKEELLHVYLNISPEETKRFNEEMLESIDYFYARFDLIPKEELDEIIDHFVETDKMLGEIQENIINLCSS